MYPKDTWRRRIPYLLRPSLFSLYQIRAAYAVSFPISVMLQDSDPMMAIRWLERQVPGAWSPRHILEHAGAVPVEPAGPREVKITLVSPDGSETTATRGPDSDRVEP